MKGDILCHFLPSLSRLSRNLICKFIEIRNLYTSCNQWIESKFDNVFPSLCSVYSQLGRSWRCYLQDCLLQMHRLIPWRVTMMIFCLTYRISEHFITKAGDCVHQRCLFKATNPLYAAIFPSLSGTLYASEFWQRATEHKIKGYISD